MSNRHFDNPGGRCVCPRTIDSEGTAAREGFQLDRTVAQTLEIYREVSWNRQDAKSANGFKSITDISFPVFGFPFLSLALLAPWR